MRHPALVPLSHDHHRGLALALKCRKQALGQIKPMGAKGLRERAKEVQEFYSTQLIGHFRAEEEVLFPLIRSLVLESERMIAQLITEHQQIRSIVAQLDGATGLGKVLFDLSDLLERHIRREERELFPLFETHVEAAKADAVGAEIKKSLGQQPN
jgi:hemerythrin-like domain-containing protein